MSKASCDDWLIYSSTKVNELLMANKDQSDRIAELREALRNILKIADHPPQQIAIGELARAALQGGEVDE